MKRMRRGFGIAMVAAGFSLLGAGPASAQWSLGVGAAALVPTSDYGDYAKTGWAVGGQLGYAVSEKVSVNGGAFYGSNDHDDIAGDKTNLIGVGGGLGYILGDAEASLVPMVSVGVGVLGHQYKSDAFPDEEGTDWQGYVSGGVGLGFPLGSIMGQVFGEYIHGFDETTLFAIGAGIAFPLGGDGM